MLKISSGWMAGSVVGLQVINSEVGAEFGWLHCAGNIIGAYSKTHNEECG